MHGTIGVHAGLSPAAAIHKRLPHIDAMRALALLGVILMNIGSMVMVVNARQVFAAASTFDMGIAAVELVLIAGKARSCFAFLFGAGFAILMLRAEAHGRDFRSYYTRRMAILLLFGLVNQVFLFWGDILVTYALLGFALMFLGQRSNAWLLRAGLAFALLPPIAHGLIEIVIGQQVTGLMQFERAAESARIAAAYTSSSYLDALAENARTGAMEHVINTAHMLVYDISIFGLFLLGAWTVRTGVLTDPGAHRKLLRRIAWVCIPLGLVLSAVDASRYLGFRPEGVVRALVDAAFVASPLLALGYLAVLGLWFARGAKWLQAFLAPAGRMSLTNYLASGAFGCWYFYGYGLGQVRMQTIPSITITAILIWLALVLFSHLWLSRLRMGPVETLWRRWSVPAGRKLSRQAVSMT